MRVKVLKGTKQIGGCITEITSSKGTKIIVDFGQDLPDEKNSKITENPKINGLTQGKSIYDAVFITHSHGDHIGLIKYINSDIPVYIERDSLDIHRKTEKYTSRSFEEYLDLKDKNIIPIDVKEKISVNNDINVTPYLADHSAYNSCMFLVECDNKKVLHTGDFRNHGRKDSLLDKAIAKIEKVDLLIVEGTSLGRGNKDSKSEEELEAEAKVLFEEYNEVYILQASTNIDRIVTFYKARGNKKFVMDMFTCEITKDLSKNIPKINNCLKKVWENLFSYKPDSYRSEKQRLFNERYKYREFDGFNQEFIMMIKSSMINDIRKVHKKGCKAVLVYSMWDGYITKEPKMQKFIDEVKKEGIEFVKLHTSGHADLKTLKYLDEKLNNPRVIAIHTYNPEDAKDVFKNIIDIEDNEEVEV